MQRFAASLLGLALAFSPAAVYGQEQDKVKIESKVKDKKGEHQEDTKVEGTQNGQSYSEKTKVRSKHGKTKVKVKTKGEPPVVDR